VTYEEELGALGPLLMAGRLDELRQRMVRLWSPDHAWGDEDAIGYVTELLRIARAEYRDLALPLYYAYERRLKDPNAEFGWLRTLPVRSQIVEAYEGPQLAITWLEKAHDAIPPPADGITDLLIGQILLAEGDAEAARVRLRAAVQRSLSGVAWYRLESLNAMTNCLTTLGEYRLAFEYLRTHAIDSYKLGRFEIRDLHKSIEGGALLFGEIDYLIEVKRNLAAREREEGNISLAAVYQSDAGFRLGQLGAREEAASALLEAADDAKKGRHPGDLHFFVVCVLLARYLRPDPLSREELIVLFVQTDEPAMVRAIRSGAAALVEEWRHLRSATDDWRRILVSAMLLALAARHYLEQGQNKDGHAVYDALIGGKRPKDAIYIFAAEDYIESLLAERQWARAEQVARSQLASMENASAHERFGLRQAVARATLGRGDRRTAHATAEEALLEWGRVLGGLYQEAHKIAWLERGAPCIECAIASLREPAAWIGEQERFRALFRLIELGKARLTADLVNHSGRLPGVYLVPEIGKRGGIGTTEWSYFQNPDLWPLVMLQLVVHADGMVTVFHDNDGRTVASRERDVEALRGVIRIPIGPEKQLYASARSLVFDDADPAPRDDITAEVRRGMER
jgi:hypothetical protein